MEKLIKKYEKSNISGKKKILSEVLKRLEKYLIKQNKK
jgi:hypothetical protein